ncbi:hypothetical protein ACFYXM_28220 [Streptomyces sp. NPDC002476]|uniref:hypothetical protein n=1 Tax=Streptomyces sp. NPDC002476 TaxID=3364648 RepID=UPI00368D5E46
MSWSGSGAKARYGVLVAAPLLVLLAACSGGGENADAAATSARPADGAATSPADDAGTADDAGMVDDAGTVGDAGTAEGAGTVGGAGASPTIDADPARLPATRGAALDLIRRVIADPESFGPGVVRRSPYESGPDTWPVLGADCVWRQEKPAPGVLATLTRSFEVPAARGKGPLRLAAVVTVHRTREDARWEMAESVEETMRCPTQQLRKGEQIGSMVAGPLARGEATQDTSEDALMEMGEYRSTALGGPHPYLWDQAQILQFTVAVTGKGAKGWSADDIGDFMSPALGAMEVRLESAVKKQG